MRNSARRGTPSISARFTIHEWQIWHSYTTYFSDGIPPLNDIAQRLVRFGIAEAAITSFGEAWWNQDDPHQSPRRSDRRKRELGHATLEMRTAYASQHATFDFPPDIAGFAAQSVYDWTWHHWGEDFLLGATTILPPYVSAHVGACILALPDSAGKIVLYPIIRIYETGVATVQFRTFSAGPVRLKPFVKDYVNAALKEYAHAFVPPGVAAWTPQAFPERRDQLWHRLPLSVFDAWYHQREVARRSWLHDGGDFQFRLAPLSIGQQQIVLKKALKDAQEEARTRSMAAVRDKAAELGLSDLVIAGLVNPASIAGLNPEEEERAARELRTHKATLIKAAEEAVESIGNNIAAEFARVGAGPETMHGLALTLVGVAGVVGCSTHGPPRSRIGEAVLGRTKANAMGNHWAGRPHVHLIRFGGQRSRASRNEEAFSREFGSIMARHVPGDFDLAEQFLPKSLRWADDFAVYLNSAVTLVAHSKSSLAQSGRGRRDDPNRDRLVHLDQVKIDVLEYGYALHRKVAEEAQRSQLDAQGLLEAQRALTDFEWALQDAGRFGEIRDLLEEGFKSFGVVQLKSRISQLLEVRRALAVERASAVSQRWTTALTVVVGLMAAPTIAESVLEPAWHRFGFPSFSRAEDLQLLLVLVSALGTISIVWFLYYWIHRRDS